MSRDSSMGEEDSLRSEIDTAEDRGEETVLDLGRRPRLTGLTPDFVKECFKARPWRGDKEP
jgi:hypothetical protein